MVLSNPEGGAPVYFDDCQREIGTINEDGTINPLGSMIEAKSRYAKNLAAKGKFGRFFRANVSEEWLNQATRQVAAAANRPVVWYFEEPGALDFARGLFEKNYKLKRIWLEHGYWAEGRNRK